MQLEKISENHRIQDKIEGMGMGDAQLVIWEDQIDYINSGCKTEDFMRRYGESP